jgi:hypothetical protein
MLNEKSELFEKSDFCSLQFGYLFIMSFGGFRYAPKFHMLTCYDKLKFWAILRNLTLFSAI